MHLLVSSITPYFDVSGSDRGAGELKGVSARVADVVEALARLRGEPLVPYTAVLGLSVEDPVEAAIEAIVGDERAVEALREVASMWGISIGTDEDLAWLALRFLTDHRYRIYARSGDALRPLEAMTRRGRAAEDVDRAIMEGRVIYTYDAEGASELLAMELLRLHQTNGHSPFFRLDHRPLLRLLMRLAPATSLDEVLRTLEGELERCKERLDALKGAGKLEDYHVGSLAFPDSYNARARALATKVYAHVRAQGRRASVEGQVNWYDMTPEMLNDEKMVRLVRANLELIGCRAVEKLVSELIGQG